MANNPILKVSPVASGATPSTGTLAAPVNANFSGPNADGVLNDLPPVVASGLDFSPFVAITGTKSALLGIAGPPSPKTHG